MIEGIDPYTTGEVMHDEEDLKGSARGRRLAKAEREAKVVGGSYQAAPISRKVPKNASKEAQLEVAKGRKEK